MPDSLLQTLLHVPNVASALTLIAAALLGGLVRGFTGFGFAMVFMPLASPVVGPAAALGLIWVVDMPFALPLALRSSGRAQWREVLPLFLAAACTLPLGVWLLRHLDPLLLRWIIALAILLAVAVLISGWRYAGRAGLWLSLSTGAASGLANGMSSLGGMPLAVFWLGAQHGSPQQTRDNLQTYFGLSTITSGVVLMLSGILTWNSVLQALPLMVPYGLALVLGTKGFHLAPERVFRRIAYGVILLAAVSAIPVWDGLRF
jgi:uncharacterized protein